jgi:hypothetical protein
LTEEATKFVLCENGYKAYSNAELVLTVGDERETIHTQPIETFLVGGYTRLIEAATEKLMAKIKREVLSAKYVDDFITKNSELIKDRIATYKRFHPEDTNPESHVIGFVDIPWEDTKVSQEVYAKILQAKQPGVPVIDRMHLKTSDATF